MSLARCYDRCRHGWKWTGVYESGRTPQSRLNYKLLGAFGLTGRLAQTERVCLNPSGQQNDEQDDEEKSADAADGNAFKNR